MHADGRARLLVSRMKIIVLREPPPSAKSMQQNWHAFCFMNIA